MQQQVFLHISGNEEKEVLEIEPKGRVGEKALVLGLVAVVNVLQAKE